MRSGWQMGHFLCLPRSGDPAKILRELPQLLRARVQTGGEFSKPFGVRITSSRAPGTEHVVAQITLNRELAHRKRSVLQSSRNRIVCIFLVQFSSALDGSRLRMETDHVR